MALQMESSTSQLYYIYGNKGPKRYMEQLFWKQMHISKPNCKIQSGNIYNKKKEWKKEKHKSLDFNHIYQQKFYPF